MYHIFQHQQEERGKKQSDPPTEWRRRNINLDNFFNKKKQCTILRKKARHSSKETLTITQNLLNFFAKENKNLYT